MTVDPFKPDAGLLCKIGSVVVHAEEAISPGGSTFDVEAIKSLLSDPAVRSWLEAMDAMALLPKKRSER